MMNASTIQNALRFAIVISVFCVPRIALAEPAIVYAVCETEPVANAGDAADDPAIWVHPSDPAQSVIIGTDKDAGLAVYDLTGKQRSFTPDGEMNNVDIRDGVPLGSKTVTLVGASNRTDNTIALYALDPASGTLHAVAARPLTIEFDVYGFCLYHDRSGNAFYAFVNSKTGLVQQWRLFDNGAGKLDAEQTAAFAVGTQLEGMVADDERNVLYVGEERAALWRYPLPIGPEPEEYTRYAVDIAQPLGNIVPDIEGLALCVEPGEAGYLIASNQGNDEFLVYERGGTNRFLGAFRIDARDGIDAVTGTDGIDVTGAALGGDFDGGLLVVQDDEDDHGNQNFKFVRWADVSAALGLD